MSKNKSIYTPSEAIRAVKGVTRKRLYEMMNNGDISYSKEEWGKKKRRVIDASELARVFPDSFKVGETTETKGNDNKKQPETTETGIENKLLEQKVEFLSQRLDDKEKQIQEKTELVSNLSSKLDKAQETIERQTYLIEDQRKPEEGKDMDANLVWLMPFLAIIVVCLALIILRSFEIL